MSVNLSLASYIDKLTKTGHTLELKIKPARGGNKSTCKVTANDGTVVAKFSGASQDDIAILLGNAASENAQVVAPSQDALGVIDYLRIFGSKARFIALDANGELVNLPELDTPIIHRQRAAAVRNGRANGAVAVYDTETKELTPIEGIGEVKITETKPVGWQQEQHNTPDSVVNVEPDDLTDEVLVSLVQIEETHTQEPSVPVGEDWATKVSRHFDMPSSSPPWSAVSSVDS